MMHFYHKDLFLSLLTVQTLMKCCLMWHFILFFTVHQSTCLPVSGMERVKGHLHPYGQALWDGGTLFYECRTFLGIFLFYSAQIKSNSATTLSLSLVISQNMKSGEIVCTFKGRPSP